MTEANLACENCGRMIGKLETPQLHDNHVVCEQCRARLSTAVRPPPLGVPPTEYRALGLNSRKVAWTLAIAGLILTPALFGIPLLIWGATAEWMLVKHQKQLRR
jgi:hypothetical protein